MLYLVKTMSENTGLDNANLNKDNPFDTRWKTADYLQEYYPPLETNPNLVEKIVTQAKTLREMRGGKVDLEELKKAVPELKDTDSEAVENYLVMDFAVRAVLEILKADGLGNYNVLDSCSGPTAYQFFPLALVAKAIYSGEYLDFNRQEIEKWAKGSPDAYPCDSYAQLTSTLLKEYWDQTKPLLEASTGAEISECQNPAALAERVRRAFVKTEPIDVFDKNKYMPEAYEMVHQQITTEAPVWGKVYAVSSTFFGSESATKFLDEWKKAIGFLTDYGTIGNEGFFLMTSLNGADSYTVGAKEMPAVNLTFEDQVKYLQQIGNLDIILAEEVTGSDKKKTHYSGMSFILCRRKPDSKPDFEKLFTEFPMSEGIY